MEISKKVEKELLSNGYTHDDIFDIEERGGKVICFLCSNKVDGAEEKITHLIAKKMLGNYDFYSGISRALNHGTAMRSTMTNEFILFINKN